MQKLLIRLANPFMKLITRSPLHGLVSRNVMLITFLGKKSGKTYTTPVNYVRDGEDLVIISQRDRTWWRNLRGGAPVQVTLQGQEMKGVGHSFEDDKAVVEGLLFTLQRVPRLRDTYQIELTAGGQPQDTEALMQLAETKVIVRVTDLTAE